MRTKFITRRGGPSRAMRGLAVLFGAVAVALAGTVGSAYGEEDKPGTTGADPITEPVPGDFRSWDELFAMQDRLNAAVDLISAARDGEGRLDDGFSGVVADPTIRRVELFWRGPAPSRVLEAIEVARRDVPVATREGRHSERELLDQSRPLVAERGVTGVSALPDGSGLDVSVSVSEEEARELPAVRAATVPLTIEPFVTPEPAFNRQDDIPPYWGGARWIGLGKCSTGFAVRLGVGSASTENMLSAGHCANNGMTAVDGGGDVMGPVIHDQSGRDTLFIRVHSAGRTYTGDVTSSTSVPVKGKQSSVVGNYVCTSGASTGQNCPIKVEAVNQIVNAQGGGQWSPMVKATKVGAGPAAGTGDSGGPVVAWSNLTEHTALAKGTISAGSGLLGPCKLSSKCFTTVYYADITQTLAFYTALGLAPSLMLG